MEWIRLTVFILGHIFQYEKVMEFISTAKKEGATILCGGARPKVKKTLVKSLLLSYLIHSVS